MAIAFNCPYCQHAHKVPDTMAGKRGKCKNPECRQVITIPAPAPEPVAIPAHLLRGPSTAVVERAALDALSDEPPKVAEVPVEQKVIEMTCDYCSHKWTEPWAKAGKNTLCPNPDCRQRVKVPIPVEETPQDWRQRKIQGPEGALKNQIQLDGVVSAGDVRNVSGKALVEADALDIEYEPKSYKLHIYVGIAAIGFLCMSIYGCVTLRSNIVGTRDDNLMADARKEFDSKATADQATLYSPPFVGLSSAVLHAAEAEYALGHVNGTKEGLEKLKTAQGCFDKARNEVRKQPPGLERNALAAEFAMAVLDFSGTEEQVKEKVRYRWSPDTEAKGALKLNDNNHTIYTELATTLPLLQGTDFEHRLITARRLTQQLAKRGQAALAADLLPVALFTEQENNEARAVIALEIYRVDKASPAVKQIAEELKTAIGGGSRGTPFPSSAQTLFTVLAIDKAPVLFAPAPPSGPVPSAAALAYTGVLLLEDKPDAAIEMAKRTQPQHPEARLKALLLCAEWAKDPTPALDAAIAAVPGTKQPAASASILRLSQLAASNGKLEQCKLLTDSLADEGLKMWAKGDAVRQRIATNPKEKAEENWLDVPDDTKKMRVGHAWARLWVARANAKESRDREKEKKATANWPGPVHAFALAGIALGLHDR